MERKSVEEKMIQKNLDNTLRDVLEILESDDGKSFEEKRDAAITRLRENPASALSEVLIETAIAEKEGNKIRKAFWSAGDMILVGSGIILREVIPPDRDGFLRIQQSYAVMRSMLREESFCDMIWHEHNEMKSLMFSVIKEGRYLGYCGIKNIVSEPYEIAVELLPEWTGKGIGFRALTAMLDALRDRLGFIEYRVRIDPSNIASQKLFERLGAEPNGISETLIHDERALQELEDENLNLIDSSLTQLAEKFGVEPRKLLSHVLEYKLIWRGGISDG